MKHLLIRGRGPAAGAIALAVGVLGGCQFYLDGADDQVYKLVQTRQREAIHREQDARLPRPRVGQQGEYPDAAHDRYAFVPSPSDDNVPPAFRETAAPAAAESPVARTRSVSTSRPAIAESQPSYSSGFEERISDSGRTVASARTVESAATRTAAREMGLSDVLAYAFRHSRQYQTAKENLYLAALSLTLERHLWEPRFFADLGVDYNYVGDLQQYDQALQAVGTAGVRQRLPYGGELIARAVNKGMGDLRDRAVDGASGQLILEGNLPLLRGAGPAAYETRYQAERNLIYAVRTFENFRRDLAVFIAGDYFNLQRLRQQIVNSQRSVRAFERDVGRTRAWFRTGRMIQLDVQRAEQAQLNAETQVVDALAAYENALDQFKIRLGMPTETPIHVQFPREPDAPAATQPSSDDALEAAIRMPAISEEDAIRVALQYRLDLKNEFDKIGDAARGIAVAQNNLLPDLNANGRVVWNTDKNLRDLVNYNAERVDYQAGLVLGVPLDRVAERNAYRQAYILKAQAERNYDEAKDDVTLQVRKAIRVVEQQRQVLRIAILNRNLAVDRRKSFDVRLAKGGVGGVDNRDLIEAENQLLDARNRLAQAQAQLSLAILQFRRDTGTLRVNDDGAWTEPSLPVP